MKTVGNSFLEHLLSYNLVSASPMQSTFLQLISFLGDWTAAADDGIQIEVVNLFQNLCAWRIIESSLKWMKEFLNGRTFRIKDMQRN